MFRGCMYERFFKRYIDFVLSLILLIVLSPIFVILMVSGAVAMRGNPFFVQKRPGKDERIFSLIKFRTMSNKRDENGELLPDDIRLNKYGRFLRSTSLDELPEIINVFIGNMSIVGPRPLLVKYLTRYDDNQKRRHEVRPGITGLAQVNGRNAISWERKFDYDVQYVDNVTLIGDLKILFQTVAKVLKREGISSETSETMEEFMGSKQEVNAHE